MTNPDYGIIFQAYLLNFKYLKRDISKINEKFLPKDINKNPIIITKHKNNIHIFEIHRDFFIKILYHRIEITISKIAPKMNLKEKDEKKTRSRISNRLPLSSPSRSPIFENTLHPTFSYSRLDVNIWKHDSRTEFFACRGRYSREHPIQRQKPSNPGTQAGSVWLESGTQVDTLCAGSSLAPALQGPCRPTHIHRAHTIVYPRTSQEHAWLRVCARLLVGVGPQYGRLRNIEE